MMVVGLTVIGGCDALFGAKDDPTTSQIFRDGESDPTLFDEVAYVPLFPFFDQPAAGGSFVEPNDIYVGYDEFVYVTDRQGLHVLDRAGRPLTFLGQVAGQPLRGAGCVMQDRRLHVYVCARRDTTITETTIVLGDTIVTTNTWDLAVVYRFENITTGGPRLADIIWHVFDDRSRTNNITYRNPRVFDSGISDEDASFTGVGVLQDNSVYIARRGPLNRPGAAPAGDGRPQTVAPFNSILIFNRNGVNTSRVSMRPDDHSVPSLRSSVYPSDVISYFAPPQRTGLTPRLDFFLAQDPPANAPVAQPSFPVLAINVVLTPDGLEYRQDTGRIGAVGDTTRGDRFLYEQDRFGRVSDLARAGDATAYLFVLDAGKDSLFIFNDAGVEGVAPPPGAQDRTKPFIVSFGGTGSGPLQFRNPQGVAYFDRIVYVADTGNNRISRFRLNTDFE
jgi:hypothetical protein